MSPETLKEPVNSVRTAGLKVKYCLENQRGILATHWIRYKHESSQTMKTFFFYNIFALGNELQIMCLITSMFCKDTRLLIHVKTLNQSNNSEDDSLYNTIENPASAIGIIHQTKHGTWKTWKNLNLFLTLLCLFCFIITVNILRKFTNAT